MANLDKLRKEAADIKKDATDMNDDKLEDYILKLLTEYYYSYVNNDMARFHTAAAYIKDAVDVSKLQDNNTDNYLNFCKAMILTNIMNAIFKRDVTLEMPDVNVAINIDAADMDERVLSVIAEAIERRYREDEIEKLKRYEAYFRELDKQAGLKAEADYMEHLIRPDADADFIKSNMSILAAILTDEGIAALNDHISGR